MTADHLSYKRATSVALIGLAIQAAFGVAVLLYGIFGKDPAGLAGAFLMLLGLPIWFSLALVFHQHKLERIERMEAEAYLGSAAAQASVFEEVGADQQVQANKLAWMHRWFLPAVSLAVAGGYIGLGVVLFLRNQDFATPDGFVKPTLAGWAIGLGVMVAAGGFVFARFVAGMAKQPMWALLHAGSAAAVGAALTGAGLVAAHFISAALKQDVLLRYLPLVFSAAMVALGAEMVLNFLLNLYRPRKPGEWLRPAFDSRVLAFVAAPDRLAESISDAVNYQFGFNVSSTWFYRLVSRSMVSLVVLAGVTLWGMSMFSIVKPDEKGLKIINGRLVSQIDRGGLVLKWPWPFGEIETFPALAVNQMQVASPAPDDKDRKKPILWTEEHSENEKARLMIVQPSRAGAGAGSDTAGAADGGDGVVSLLAAEVPVHYTVRDLKAYKMLAQDAPGGDRESMRQELLKALAAGVVTEHLGSCSADELLGARRDEIAGRLKRLIQAEFDAVGAGIEVTFVGLAGAHPHMDVASSYLRVFGADQERQAQTEAARKAEIEAFARVAGDVDRARRILAELQKLDAMKQAQGTGGATPEEVLRQERVVMELIVAAGGEAAEKISDATAYRWERLLGERGRAVRSEGQIALHRAAPDAYRAEEYLAALREAASGARVYITPFVPKIRINKEEIAPDVSGFAAGSTEGEDEGEGTDQ